MKKRHQNGESCIALLLFGWFTVLLGNRPFATPDEARYVEIPREMVATGDYITPRLNGVKYFEKPPLFYWLQAATLKIFGPDEGGMRLWVTLFATLGCLAVYLFGARLFSHKTGLIATIILATSPLYYALGRLIILDMAVSVLVTIALLSFLQTVHTPPGQKRRLLAYLFYTACALGVLTKGIMTMAVVGCVIVIWATITRSWRDLWPAYLPTGIALFLAISAPWHILASLKNPEFAHKYFIVEHVLRYTTSVHDRSKPFYFFIPVIFLGFFPWICLFVQRSKNEHKKIETFLWTWILFVFGFFSIGNSKLVPYVLPVFPPLALLAALKWQTCNPLSIARFHGLTSLLIGIASIATLYLFPQLLAGKQHVLPYGITLAGTFIVFGLASFFYKHLLVLPAHAIAIIITLIVASPHIQRPSIKPIADYILSIKKPEDRVVCFTYFQDLPLYLNQTITVFSGWGELEFGTTVEDTTSWMVNEEGLRKIWQTGHTTFVVVREKTLDLFLSFFPDATPLKQENGYWVLRTPVPQHP